MIHPHTFLTTEKWNAKLMGFFLPRKRPQDNMALGVGEPQEDEFALCALTGRAWPLAWAFPRRADHYNRYLTLRGASLGGGIYSYNATLILANSTLSDNAAAYGGGLYNNSYNHPGMATFTDSTVQGNTALQGGGGIDNNNGATLTIAGSTLSGNSAGIGGGLHNYNGSVTVTNSTLSGNSAGNGGGVANTSGPLTITDSTIAGNSANTVGGLFDGGTGLQMRNTIVAGNVAGMFADLDGRLSSSGYNLVGVPVGGSGFDPTDLLGADPLLGTLQDNGGPTPTLALQPGSPALDAGDPAQLGVPDQRGVVRRGGVNIGAFQASASAFVLTAPARVRAGVPFAVTVTAVDPFGQVAVGYAGTVSFRTTDPDPHVVLPADYTFTLGDAGVHTFSDTGLGETTLVTRGYQTISVTDTVDGSLTGGTTVQVKHVRHHHDEIPDLPAALKMASMSIADRIAPGSPAAAGARPRSVLAPRVQGDGHGT